MNCGARMGALIALLGASAAHASSIVSSDIQSGDLFGPGVAIGIEPFVGVFNYAGIGFTPSQTYTFDSAELAMSLSSGPNVVDVYLMGSSGGLPSGILESFVLSGALSSAPSLVTIDSVMHPVLDAGVQYWLVAAGGASTTAFWQQNVHNVMGPNVSGPTLSSLVLDSDTNVIEAYEINGDAAVPEPQSWMLMLTGAIGLMWRGRRTPRS
jgi:PEP-CTERM motif